MIDSACYNLLQSTIRREGRSLLQYVIDSYPYHTDAEAETWKQLRELAREESDQVAALAGLLLRHRLTPPYLGSYPMAFTTLNFVALDFLLKRLVGHQKNLIAELEKDLNQVHDEEVRGLLRQTLEMKRRHLKGLEGLAALKTATT